MLSELFPDSIRLTPDVGGRYLWAMFDANIAPLLSAEQRFAECGGDFARSCGPAD